MSPVIGMKFENVCLLLLLVVALVPRLSIADTANKQPRAQSRLTDARPVMPGASLRLARANAALRQEPSFEELKNAALKLADADAQRTSGLLRQAGIQAVLPTLKLTADLDLERDESLNKQENAVDKWRADTDRDVELQVSAQWKLSELIFNPDTLRVHSTLSKRASDREKLISLLAGYVFERRKLILISAVSPEADLRRSVEIQIRIEELTAIIDALTGGLLTRRQSVSDLP